MIYIYIYICLYTYLFLGSLRIFYSSTVYDVCCIFYNITCINNRNFLDSNNETSHQPIRRCTCHFGRFLLVIDFGIAYIMANLKEE